ncbi:hypothetical protein AX17_001984 [Amanita inopinata Kibby_2008]|nr:hypothetical protein AX17_001984 [Amanita inopinata Kibby_2008]
MSKHQSPPKRVHFADKCVTFATRETYRTSIINDNTNDSRTPSPTHSDSDASIPSSSSFPPTPPSAPVMAQYTPSPYPRTSPPLSLDFSPPQQKMVSPSPSLSQVPMAMPMSMTAPMSVHYLLAYSPFTPSPLAHDISQSPTLVEKLCSSHQLMEPATNPPLQRIILTCPLLPKHWQLTIYASSASNPIASPHPHPRPPTGGAGYVTVQDVLRGMYTELRWAVHPSEYNTRDKLEVKLIDEAYWERCARALDPRAQEEQKLKGVRKVDFLKGHCRFLGLSGTLVAGDVWELNLS